FDDPPERRTIMTTTIVKNPPCATPAAAIHTRYPCGARSRPAGSTSQHPTSTADTVRSWRPRASSAGAPRLPTIAMSWNTDDAAPAPSFDSPIVSARIDGSHVLDP